MGELAVALDSLHSEGLAHEADIKRLLDVYLVRGGYPATQLPATDQDSFRFIENTIDTILSKDLKLYEKVRKPGTFRAFLAKLAKEHGGKFVAASYAKDLGVDKETPAVWKTIAEELFLVHQLPQLNPSFAVIPGRADKAYMQDPGIRAYLSASPRIEDLEQSGVIGNVVEGVLFDHLRRLQFNTLGHRNGRIGYWEKPEVDFVVELPRAHLVIECKYRNASGSGAARLREVAGKGERIIALVVTRDTFDVKSNAWSVPAWLMLLIA
jgi:predicted AAA+ superfamily ATPase